jgi:UDP-N-acetylmuramoyl-L-alanyl-D-glutamate--2,6-diaminopimelate ligase
LPARFNVYNALVAIGVADALGIARSVAVDALADVSAPPGRMERIASDGIDVIVDYAHTPDALGNVLQAAREGTRGRLVVVFGCGGDRDPGKRPQMGEIAARLADLAIVTSDNPRSEDPQTIADAIVAGGKGEIELDRRAAIRRAIAGARPGDVVVIAGKGHETYQIVGDRTRHFDDREEVRAAFAARSGGAV